MPASRLTKSERSARSALGRKLAAAARRAGSAWTLLSTASQMRGARGRVASRVVDCMAAASELERSINRLRASLKG